MPPTFKNLLVNDQASMTFVEGDLNQYGHAEKINEGMSILYRHAAPSALHDSGERFDPPKCHPNTRVAVQEEILRWIDDLDSEHHAMWIHGAMGAGKSAITQEIAQICFDRGQLSSSFFFARASSSGRNDEKRLVATLAYQMSKLIPETRILISSTIVEDHLIFESSLTAQLEALIINPLCQIVDSISRSKRRVIISDGLDECYPNIKAQALIVRVFVSAFAEARTTHRLQVPHKILIVSRPETNIEAAFNMPEVFPFVRRLSLDSKWGPDADIRRFLVDSFAEIKRTHLLGPLIPPGWPPTQDIDRLVQKSFGQFIYSSVVIKFIQSPRRHPMQCLKIILGLVHDVKNRPYEELDILYAYIFSKVDDLDLLLHALCICTDPFTSSSCDTIEEFLDLPQGTLRVAFGDLASVISLSSDIRPRIVFLHASLPEYLMDENRSGIYYVNSEAICGDLAQKCITLMSQNYYWDFDRDSVIFLCLDYLGSLTSNATIEAQAQIFEVISKMDLISHLEPALSVVNSQSNESMYQVFGNFIRWILDEYKNAKSSMTKNLLSEAVEHIKDWIISQLKAFPYNGFDDADGQIDIWIFAGVRGSNVMVKNLIDQGNILFGPSFDSEAVSQLITPSVELAWFLICHIWRGDDLDFQEYSFTEIRYLQSAIYHFPKFLSPVRPSAYLHHLNSFAFFITSAAPDEMLDTSLQTTVSVTPEKGRRNERRMSEGAFRAFEYLRKRYESQGPLSPLDWSKLVDFAIAIYNYLEKTHKALPDLEPPFKELSAPEEPRKAKKRKYRSEEDVFDSVE